jgi:hypothetical protein
MGLIERLRGKNLHPAWHHAAQGNLWQLQVGSPLFLLGEARDQKRKRATFFSIVRETGRVNWEGTSPVDAWWTGVEGVFRGVVLFHGFATPDLPMHRGIYAVDGMGGSPLWSAPDLRFLWCAGGIVGARSFTGEGPVETFLNLATGEGGGVSSGEGHHRPATPEPEEPAEYPRPIGQVSESGDTGAAHLRRVIPAGAEEDSVYALLSNGEAVVEYATRRPDAPDSSPSFEVHIMVLGRDGQRRFQAAVLSGAPTARPEPFFVQRGILFYVADRTALIAVPLQRE